MQTRTTLNIFLDNFAVCAAVMFVLLSMCPVLLYVLLTKKSNISDCCFVVRIFLNCFLMQKRFILL